MNCCRRHFVTGLLATTAAASLSACGTVNPATGRSSFTGFASIDDDVKLGAREHANMVKEFGGEYENARLQRYVDTVGRQLAAATEHPELPYRFTILNTPIVNAFALPGGYVYLSRGLLALADTEAEMAGVLAHELGHVNARHSAERIAATQIAQIGLLAGAIGAAALGLPGETMQLGQSIAVMSIQSYSRQQELEADSLGVRYLSRVGYDADAMASFLETLHEQSVIDAEMKGLPPGKVDEFNIMATHPRTIDRVEQAKQAAAAIVGLPQSPRVGRDIYLDSIDGMMFGDDPKQGIVRGALFQHPVMRFEFRVPDEFRIVNSETEVTAQNRSGSAVLFDVAPVRGSRDMVGYLNNEWAANVRLRDVERLNVNGLDAATGWTRVQDRRGGTIDLRGVAIQRDARSAYRFLFLSPTQETARLSEGFRGTTYSFRRLSEAEAAAIRPLRLLIVPARPDDTVTGLARTLPYGKFNDRWFLMLNNMKPGSRLTSGQRVKVIAA